MEYKTLLLTIVYMVTSYGRIVGAWIGTVVFNNHWRKAFSCCGVIFFSLSFGLFSIPQKYYSTKYMIVQQKKTITGNVVEKIVPTKDSNIDYTDNTDSEIKKDIEKIKDIKYIDDDSNVKTSLSSKETGKKDKNKNKKKDKKEKIKEKEKEMNEENDIEMEIKNTNNDIKEKLIYDYNTNTNENINDENKMYKNLTYFGKFKIVILNKCFIFSSFSRASVFFTFKIVHVFLKKYSFEALKYNNEIKFFYYYSLTSILAPSLGSLIGGAICNKFLGGYESRKSIWIILVFGTVSVIFISLARISIDFNYLIVYIFIYFFSISAFLPTISGYIINSLHKELKGFGSSFDSLITNVFGKLPSPIIYGIINDRHKKEDPKYAWNKSLMIFYIGSICIYLTCFYKWKTNSVKPKITNNVVKKTMKDAYTFNRSSLLKAERHVPKYDKKLQKPVELEDVDEESSTTFINKVEKRNKDSKKKILKKLQKKENERSNDYSN